ncbi:MAG: glycosyltransferase family 39 protein [Chloroflexi bacterium]|nr:glycosyltransferase family 39 protein [Chloroflexota bacterium]
MSEQKRPFPQAAPSSRWPARSRWSARNQWPIIAILFLFILLASLYSWLIPPFEGPDEAQHFAYITWLADRLELPPQGAAAWETPVQQEASQPPFYYFLASLPMRIGRLTEPSAVYRPNPHYLAPLPHDLPDNDNVAIHYPTDTRPLQGGWLAFYLARGVTLLFGLLLIISAYGLARQIRPAAPHIAWGTAFLIAVTPQVVYLSGMVSNDIPAAALSALALWALVVLLQRPSLSPWLALLTGSLFGLAGLTKVSALVLLVPAGVGLGWLWVSRQQPFRSVLWAGLGMAGGVTAVAGWWFARNWLLFGSPVGLDTHDYAPWSLSNGGTLAGQNARWVEVTRSYWLALGWGAIRPADWVYAGFFILMLLAAVGLLRLARRWQKTAPPRPTPLLPILLLVTVAVVALFLEIWMRRVVAPHGRLLFPALAPISLLLVIGWDALHPRLPLVGYGFVLACALAAPLLLLKPAYVPNLLAETELNAIPPTLGWQFGADADHPLVQILRIDLPPQASAGSIVPVEVCWRALGQTDTDYTFLLQIIGPGNGLAAARRTYPGNGLLPSSAWQSGDGSCDTIHIGVPEALAATLVYQVEIGLIDEAAGQRLPAFTAVGDPLPNPFAASIRLEAHDTPVTAVSPTATDPIQLLDATFNPTWTPGTSETLRLTWAANQPLTGDYQTFVHLRAGAAAPPIAQADGSPLDDWYPTSWWPVGEIITDERPFPIPADLPPGVYQLVVGWYDLASGERLGQEFPLGQVTINGKTD